MTDFNEIRPYNNDEIRPAMQRIARHPLLEPVLSYLFPERNIKEIRAEIASIDTIEDFQKHIMLKSIHSILDKTSNKLTYSGLENIKADKKHLLISNHRDILLDSGIIQTIMHDNNLPTSEMAVGDNLITEQFIEDIARANKMIKVVRSTNPKELYNSSLLLSSYIRYIITSGQSSVWIAQRNGRTKNGIDITEQGLLKMFDMSCSGSFTEGFKQLSIVPVSISYEYEPCDHLKTKEIYVSRRQKYVKAAGEDIVSILTGIVQEKGNIHIHFGKPISEEEIDSVSVLEKNDRFKALAEIIDKGIVGGFKLWKNNFIAYDILNETKEYSSEYTNDEKEEFIKYYKNKISELFGDRDEIEEIMLSIYANPVLNIKRLN